MLALNSRPVRPAPRKHGAGSAPQPDATRPRTVLLVHNYYQNPGGEDGVFEAESRLLEDNGQRVLRYVLHNDDVAGVPRVRLAARSLWSASSYRAVRRLVERERVDVVHVHNTLPLASPSVLYAARHGGAAVVQTLHNYRLVCPGALLMRGQALCHDCVGRRLAVPGIRHGCYRGSRAATAVVAATTALHSAAGTYHRVVDRYIALNEFAREIFVGAGLPAERIVVKPNAVESASAFSPGGPGVLFAGRLSHEKGVATMLRAWAHDPELPELVVAGSGPLEGEVAAAAARDVRIRPVGWQSHEALAALVARSSLLVAPSTCYEGWPLTVAEALSVGTPVVATNHGAFLELVVDGVSGRLVPPGDPAALAGAVRELVADPEALAAMRRVAYDTYHARFPSGSSYARLRDVYDAALAQRALR